MPAPADLPDDVAALAWHNAIEVSDSRWDYDVGRLVSRLEVAVPALQAPVSVPSPAPGSVVAEVLDEGPAAVGPCPSTPTRRFRFRPPTWAVVLVALVAIGVVLSAFAIARLFEDELGGGRLALAEPLGVAVSGGTLYVADAANNRVVAITSAGQATVAGNGDRARGVNGIAATDVALARPGALAVDEDGSFYMAEVYAGGITKVSLDGKINEVPAHSPGLDSIRVQAMAVRPNGDLLVATDREILRVRSDGTVESLAGTASGMGFSGDGGPATSAKLSSPMGLAVDSQDNIYVADTLNHRVRKIGLDGNIVTVAGTGYPKPSGDGGPAVEADVVSPRGIAVAPNGSVYVGGGHQVREIRPDGTIVRLAGAADNAPGFAGDGGPADAALLNEVYGLALDQYGNLYFSDSRNNIVRKISTERIITTVAS